MSAFEELEKEGLISKAELKSLKRRAQIKAKQLKILRTAIDKRARYVFRNHYIANGRKWDSKTRRQQFRDLMAARHKLHERIARLVPEKVEPEWDSP